MDQLKFPVKHHILLWFLALLLLTTCTNYPDCKAVSRQDLNTREVKRLPGSGTVATGNIVPDENAKPGMVDSIEQIEQAYNAGLLAMEKRNLELALFHFNKVLELDDDYRDVNQRITWVQSELKNLHQGVILNKYYSEGINAMNQNDLGQALIAFNHVLTIDSSYQKVKELIAKIDHDLNNVNALELSRKQNSLLQYLDSLYYAGKGYMEKKYWPEALLTLGRINLLYPDYRDTNALLKMVRINLNLYKTWGPARSSSVLEFGSRHFSSIIASLIVVPLLILLIFSPATRGRFYLLIGHYSGAAMIFKRLIEQNKQTMNILGILAMACLYLRQKNDQALRNYLQTMKANPMTRRLIQASADSIKQDRRGESLDLEQEV